MMNKKFLWSVLSILVLMGLVIIGFSMHQHQKKQEMIRIAISKEARKVYEEHMRANDPNALTREGVIQSYEVDTETLEYNPMGGLMVRLYFNNNKELDFHFGLIKNDNGEYETYGYTVSPKLSALLKENVK